MKNFFLIVLMLVIVIGTCFGVKAEIDAWNKKYNAPIEETKNIIDEAKEKVDEINNEEKDSEIDLSDFE